MLDFHVKENAPALLLVLATVILAITFSIPVGGERRRSQTRYQSLSGFAGAFEVRQSSSPLAIAAAEPSVSVKASPKGTSESLHKLARARRTLAKYAPSHAWPHLVSAQTPSTLAASVEKSSVTISSATFAAKTLPAANAPARVAAETADFVSEAYDSDPAKYPMERSTAQGSITLSLCGLSRQKSRYILKVAVTNSGGDDFFVKELSVRDGRTTLSSKSFFRLFVEPGRAREGFVVFDVPRIGAEVHVALKEDREKGRVVELPVPYSF